MPIGTVIQNNTRSHVYFLYCTLIIHKNIYPCLTSTTPNNPNLALLSPDVLFYDGVATSKTTEKFYYACDSSFCSSSFSFSKNPSPSEEIYSEIVANFSTDFGYAFAWSSCSASGCDSYSWRSFSS